MSATGWPQGLDKQPKPESMHATYSQKKVKSSRQRKEPAIPGLLACNPLKLNDKKSAVRDAKMSVVGMMGAVGGASGRLRTKLSTDCAGVIKGIIRMKGLPAFVRACVERSDVSRQRAVHPGLRGHAPAAR
jgi:hypothetical protein